MPTSLSKEHRKLLEKTTADARVLAESACRAALENLAVHEKEYRTHMSVEQRLLRNRLRARGRALGDKRDERSGIQEIRHLIDLAAYEHWHRLLFTRFLTENHFLITDEANGSVPVTLEECEELAPELGARDGQDLACRFAGLTLPGVFRRDDPVLDLPIAINDQVELRKLLTVLPSEAFLADDALGWTYQFWQAQRKDEVNKSGKKIGADEISPVTQLFTEDYMVEFLLHNTLGAWWAGKIGPIMAVTEEEARAHGALPARDGLPAISWTYLRFVQDETTKTWLPAAGTFDGWPKVASLIRLLDPCMGSGHFLVFALPLLVRLRMDEENLSAQAAVVAVLKDNIHGLELDERCTQIAAFNVALTAWKLAGYQALPILNLACSGLAPNATEAEWVALAGDSSRARNGMASLHRLFKDAPVLGSLINPRAQGGDLFDAKFHELSPLLEKALAQEMKDDIAHEMAVTARGLTKAAEILDGQFTIVTTNVPYLGRNKQDDVLVNFCAHVHPEGKTDLSTCFVQRCLAFCAASGSSALVSPQNWWFLTTYSNFRKMILTNYQVELAVTLGEEAWQAFGDRGPMAVLMIVTKANASKTHEMSGIDALSLPTIPLKAKELVSGVLKSLLQEKQLRNPDHRILLEELAAFELLEYYADGLQGVSTADLGRFIRGFWENCAIEKPWTSLQSSFPETALYSGRHQILNLGELERVVEELGAAIRGTKAWGKQSVIVRSMRHMAVTQGTGEVFDANVACVLPKRPEYFLPIWSYCCSENYAADLKKIDKKTGVTNATLVKVPFDFAHWQKVAAEKFPDGLPKPYSNDPTQWLFYGHPNPQHPHGMLNRSPNSDGSPFIIHNLSFILHVAVVRLLGYRWPRQTGSSFPDCPALGPDGLESFADEDGIVCLPPLSREQPAAARLRRLLTAALGAFDERALIAAAGLKGSKSKTLEDWLRDEFFEQHAKLFHDRPFIWHIWDGRSDGFHSLVNYHKLDHAALQKLTYSYLGNWIQQQSDDAKADKPGAAERLGSARKLQTELSKILEGEADPNTNTGYDIFVRWKPLKDQAQGWHPDINDGIRQNIRPFLLAGDVGKRGAGLFRTVPLKLKDKDRGTEPHRPKADYPWFWCEESPGTDPPGGKDFVGSRWNDVHLTLARKKEVSS